MKLLCKFKLMYLIYLFFLLSVKHFGDMPFSLMVLAKFIIHLILVRRYVSLYSATGAGYHCPHQTIKDR